MGYWRQVNKSRHRKRKTKDRKLTRNGSRGAAYSQCTSKVGYSSLRHAERIAREIEAKRGDKLRIYECPVCGLYHLTKKGGHEF